MLHNCQLRGRERTLLQQELTGHFGQLATTLQLEYSLFNEIIEKVLEIHEYVPILHFFPKDQNESDSGST